MQTYTFPGGLRHAIKILKRGGVVAFPTDTIYGLGANILSPQAVERVYKIKGRPSSMALPLLLSDVGELEQIAAEVPEMALTLAQRFWPGGLTLILKASPQIPPAVTGGGDTVAVRLPNHPVPIELVRGLGHPITGTSANPSGGPDPITARDVERLLGDRVDCIIDYATPTQGKSSTVVDLTGITPRMLRQGIVTLEEITEVCELAGVGA